MRLKYKIMLALIVVAMGLCFMTLQSYALWIARYASGDNIVGVGCYSVSFTEDVEHGPISLNNTYPVSDATALSSGVYYSFTIRNTCTTASGYAITINPLTTNTLAKNKIKYALYKTTDTAPSTGINLGTVTEYNTDLEGYSNAALISESIILDTGYLGPGTTSNAVDGESVTYRLYLWMDENDTIDDINKVFEASIYVSNYARAKEKTSSDTLALLQSLNPNITLTQSTSVNPNFARPAPQSSAGRTYSSDYRSLADASDTYITYASDYTYDELTGVYSLIDYTTCRYGDCFEDLIDKYIVVNNDSTWGSINNEAIYQSVAIMNNEVDKVIYADEYQDIGVIAYTDTELNEIKNGTWQLQTSGLYELEDDYGESYYFRGDIDYNYVKFGTWKTDYYSGRINSNNDMWQYTSLADCQAAGGSSSCTKYASIGDDMYWRIVRINGDGSIRLIYDGTSAYNMNDTGKRSIGQGPYNTIKNDNAYVGYMYGTAGSNNYNDTHTNTNDSTVKTILDNWYQTNLLDVSSYVADSIFCNDRSIASADTMNFASILWNMSLTSNAYGTNNTMYGAIGRIIDEHNRGLGNKATLKCPQKNDAFTVNDTVNGNGALTYPVGLISLDEVDIAGIGDGNRDYYINSRMYYFLGSPYDYFNGSARISEVSQGILSRSNVSSSIHLRPVINLKAEAITSGSGTALDPFVVD